MLSGSISEVRVDSAAQQVVVQLAGQAEPVAVSYAAGPVMIQDEAGNRYRVDEQGEVSQKAGAVAGAGSDTGTGTAPASNNLAVRLFGAILDNFAERMDAWLLLQGKGPLDYYEMRLLEGLPTCLPQDEAFVNQLRQEDLPTFQQDKAGFVALVMTEHESVVSEVLSAYQPTATLIDLSAEDRLRLEEAACQTMVTIGIDRVIACLVGAVVDVGLQYTFEWVGMWMEDESVAFSDYEAITAQMDVPATLSICYLSGARLAIA